MEAILRKLEEAYKNLKSCKHGKVLGVEEPT